MKSIMRIGKSKSRVGGGHVASWAASLCVGALSCGNASAADVGGALRVNEKRIESRILQLGEYGKQPEGGVSRVSFTDADIAGRRYVSSLMRNAGLTVEIDAAGNIVGRRPGKIAGRAPIVFGSHIDTVPRGGNYDGNVGVIGGIECIEVLKEHGLQTNHPLEVVVFSSEEGGHVGSKALTGGLTKEGLAGTSQGGMTVAEGIERIGGDVAKLAGVVRRKQDVAAYIELHVEQSGMLEESSIDIGVVEGIVGIRRWNVSIVGFANHAGATPMNKRKDAMLAASYFTVAVNEIVRSRPGRQVGTVGRVRVEPGAPNVVPGKAVVTLELRDLSDEKIAELFEEIRKESQRIAAKTGTLISLEEIGLATRSVRTDERMRAAIAATAKELGLSSTSMPSGAGHDAQELARIAPMGMIFVPSVGGISHAPDEFTSPEDMANGANVLLHTILKLDESTWQ